MGKQHSSWWINDSTGPTGPISPAQLKELALVGQVHPQTRVSRSKSGPWVPAGRLRGLFQLQSNPYDAFISYSYLDAKPVKQLTKLIEAEDISCWMAPRDILPGSKWGEAIVRGIESCPVFVLILSSSSNTSRQILQEVERAAAKNKTIIPVRLHDIKTSTQLELYLGSAHWLDAFADNLTPTARSLAAAIKQGRSKASRIDAPRTGAAVPASRFYAKRWMWQAGAALVATLAVFFAWTSEASQGDAQQSKPTYTTSSMSPKELVELGTSLMADPDTLTDGVDCLEAAFIASPSTPDLADLLTAAFNRLITDLSAAGHWNRALREAFRALGHDLDPGHFQSRLDNIRQLIQSHVTILDPKPGAILPQGHFTISGQTSFGGMPFALLLDERIVRVIDSTFTAPVSKLPEGETTVELILDLGSDVRIPIETTYTIDTESPSLVTTTPRQDQVVRSPVRVQGRVEDCSPVELTVHGNDVRPDPDGLWSVDLPLEDGAAVITVFASDVFGRVGSDSVAVIVDSTPPTIEGAPEDGVFYTRQATARPILTITDPNLASVSFEGALVAPDADGHVEVLLITGPTLAETRRSRLSAIDHAGNERFLELQAARDWEKPSVEVDASQEALPGTTVYISGTFSDLSPCVFHGSDEPRLVTDGRIGVPFDIPPKSPPGETLSIAWTVVDAAGNAVSGEHLIRILEPCGACIPTIGKRGDCPDCLDGTRTEACRRHCRNGYYQQACISCANTGKSLCWYCQGDAKGNPTLCLICQGKRPTCSKCRGKQEYEYCASCGGDGKVTLGGSLGFKSVVKCSQCSGTGSQKKKCKACKGSWTEACTHCDDGYQETRCEHCRDGRTDKDCKTCNGDRVQRIKCDQCPGTGQLVLNCRNCEGSRQCPKCAGTGVAKN